MSFPHQFSTSLYPDNKSLKLGGVTVSHLILSSSSLDQFCVSTQSSLGQNKKCRGKPEAELDLKDSQCQELHARSQSSQAAAGAACSEASASVCSLTRLVARRWDGALLQGLSSWARDKSMYREGFVVQGYACMGNALQEQLFTCTALGSHQSSPKCVLGSSPSEGLSSAHFVCVCQWLQRGVRQLGLIPVSVEWRTSPLSLCSV